MVITSPQKQEATFGVRAVGLVTFFFIGWWWGYAPGILCLVWSYHPPPGSGLQFCRRTQKTLLCIFLWVGTRTLSQGCTTIWLFLLCFWIPSLPWLAIVWIHPSKLREGQGGWMKPISYRQEMENTEQICTPEPHRVLLSFNLGN